MHVPKTERQAELMALADTLARRIGERAAEHDREGTFPHEALQLLHESGYLALTAPEEYGGRGANPLEIALAQERLARGDGSVALGVTMHLATIGRQADARSWPPELFARVCRDVVEHGALINAAASEPELGSPSRGGMPRTTAHRDGGGWRITGRKTWTSLAPGMAYFVVSAAVDEEGKPPQRASFLVRSSTPGVRVEKTWDSLSMRAIGNDDVVLEEAWVADDARLPGDGAKTRGDARGWGLVPASVYVGIAAAARDFAVSYARERRPSGGSGPIAEFQTIQHRVAEIELLQLHARSVLYGTAETWVDQPACRDEIAWQIAASKYVATNNAIRVTDLALRVVGAAGLAKSQPLERYFRDVRAGLGHPPMDDATLTLIGKTALGV